METIQTNIQQTPQTTNIAEGKKESIDSARVSAETALKDSKIKETIGRTFGGILGVLVLLGSVTNVIEDFKVKKRNTWVYPRIILDFMASGALIGYALENTVLGLKAGLLVGFLTLLIELLFIKK